MTDQMPAYMVKWLGKYVEWSDSGAWRRGKVLEVERYVWDNRPRLRMRILGDNGFIYPGVAEALVTDITT